MQRTCSRCPNLLNGRQRLYCSSLCASRGFNASRAADGRLREYHQREAVKARNRERLRQAAADRRYITQAITCERCGKSITVRIGEPTRFCSGTCVNAARVRARPARVRREPVDQRSPLRRAWEAQDWDSVQAELLARTRRELTGCRVWTGTKNKDGYATVRIADRRWSAYRIMAAAISGAEVPALLTVHHRQVVPSSANVAEMLHCRWYLARIAELERALEQAAPGHPLLTQIPFAS